MRHSMRLYIFVFLFLIVPAHAFADEDKFLDIQRVESASGISAWLVEDHSVPVISVKFSFLGSGSKNESVETQGLMRMLSNTMDEGAGDLDSQAFQKQLRDYSITLNFNASRDHFGGQVKTLTQNKARAFELLRLALTNPRFDVDAVDRMRAANQSRIKSSVISPQWIAARIQNDRIFEGHAYALNSGGTLSSLAAVTPDDLRAAHKKYIGKTNLVIGVSGDITSEELAVILDQVFGALPDIETYENEVFDVLNAGKTYVHIMDVPQTVVQISHQGVRREDDDYFAAKVMSFILGESGFGSRLMEEIREKRGLTYGIYSYFREYDETDALHVSTSTVNGSVLEMISLIKAEWARMRDNMVSEEELSDAKSYLTGSMPLALSSTDAIAGILLSLQENGRDVDYLDHYAENIEAVTAEDIQKAAQRILDEEAFTTILVGNPEGLETAEEITHIPNVE